MLLVTCEDYALLRKLNDITSEKYKSMTEAAEGLNGFMADLLEQCNLQLHAVSPHIRSFILVHFFVIVLMITLSCFAAALRMQSILSVDVLACGFLGAQSLDPNLLVVANIV